MDRQELLKKEEEAWAGLVAAYSAVPPERRQVESVVPGWSTHDLVWHCAYWANWATEAMERIRRGEDEQTEPEDDDAWVAEILAAGRALTWEQAIESLENDRRNARAAFERFETPPQGAIDRFVDEAVNHYDEHAEQIRAFTG